MKPLTLKVGCHVLIKIPFCDIQLLNSNIFVLKWSPFSFSEVFTSPSNHLTIGCTNAKTPRNTRAVLHSARILIESAKRGVARHRSLGSHRFRSFHTPSTSHTVRQEYCSHLSKSESRANKDANHLDSRLLDVDGKLPSDLRSDNLFETEKHKEEGNRVNLNPVQEPCATANKDINMDGQSQQVDESNKSKDEALTVGSKTKLS
ncbi:Uncharacterised protein g8320 [Pycnogonum litorale]